MTDQEINYAELNPNEFITELKKVTKDAINEDLGSHNLGDAIDKLSESDHKDHHIDSTPASRLISSIIDARYSTEIQRCSSSISQEEILHE